MEKYKIDGMSCSACKTHVEMAVKSLDKDAYVNVSLITNEMEVDSKVKKDKIIKAIKKAGYSASYIDKNTKSIHNSFMEKDKEIVYLSKRFIASIILLICLMYLSMGHMIGLKLYNLIDNPIYLSIIELLLSALILYINKIFFISGFKSLFALKPNMDSLVAIGSISSFIYSIFYTFLILTNQNNPTLLHDIFTNHIYFEECSMIPTIVTLGKIMESYSKNKTKNAIKSLIELSPKTATILKNNKEITVSIDDIKLDDILVLRPGEKIPIDGIIIEGETSIDESSLTGESIPKDKYKGDYVRSGTINFSGYIKVMAKKVGKDTTLNKIIDLVIKSSSTKAPIQRIADKISYFFVPTIILLSIITFTLYLTFNAEFTYAFKRAVSVLLISCPCALGLATPLSIMVGNGKASQHGILFKNASSLENTGKADIIVFDKTGTITYGKPTVTDVFIEDNITYDTFLSYALSLESKSEHPIGKAITSYCKDKNINELKLSSFKNLPGNGVKGTILNKTIYLGNISLIRDKLKVNIPNTALKKIEELSKIGKIPTLMSTEDTFLGMIYLSDMIKEYSKDAISSLKQMGLSVIMLTGDNNNSAKYVASLVKIPKVISEVMPDEKQNVINKLKKDHKVIMVGDGINDAPSLINADIGIAVGTGSDISLDSADVILENNNLKDIVSLINISRLTIRNIKENLFFSFFYNIICIPFAMGLYQKIFNINFELNPMISSVLMSLSSVSVCLNALRLNFIDKKIYNKK